MRSPTTAVRNWRACCTVSIGLLPARIRSGEDCHADVAFPLSPTKRSLECVRMIGMLLAL
jgi:hypothetical protein